ncbi:hypothetical protein ACFHYQ_15125 [Sphaerimonospora cavernae]|uniref:HD domain-containing protein n=1 Tax=Sphaerimonospora cavernae TaxID=1740611 RepID=A0ABV6U5A6_9ACTN
MRDVGVEAGHLIRLAGELHDLGMDSVVRLPPHHEPTMEIPLYDAGSRLRVTAVRAAHEARLAATAEAVRLARAAEVLSDRDDVSGAPGVRVLWRAR